MKERKKKKSLVPFLSSCDIHTEHWEQTDTHTRVQPMQFWKIFFKKEMEGGKREQAQWSEQLTCQQQQKQMKQNN